MVVFVFPQKEHELRRRRCAGRCFSKCKTVSCVTQADKKKRFTAVAFIRQMGSEKNIPFLRDFLMMSQL